MELSGVREREETALPRLGWETYFIQQHFTEFFHIPLTVFRFGDIVVNKANKQTKSPTIFFEDVRQE